MLHRIWALFQKEEVRAWTVPDEEGLSPLRRLRGG